MLIVKLFIWFTYCPLFQNIFCTTDDLVKIHKPDVYEASSQFYSGFPPVA